MIEIGTNFSYKGPLFLDNRHGIATSKYDLLHWSIPVPEGFEVYLNLENDPAWYTYNSKADEPETGHFQKRIDKTWVDRKINIINTSIDNIDSEITDIWSVVNEIEVKNLSLQIVNSNGGKYNIGEQVTPSFGWVLKSYGEVVNIQEASEVLINNNSIGKVNSWTSSETISSDRDYTVTVLYKGNSIRQTVSYVFQRYDWTKYFGVSSNSNVTSIDQLDIIEQVSGWGTTSIGYQGTADCSGGKYPYYIFPSTLYNQATFKMFIGGFRTTAFVVNQNAIQIEGVNYSTIRTEYIQTGTMQIRYE